jgi:DNA-binding response OmpR family regulator
LGTGQSFILGCRTWLFFPWGETMERLGQRQVSILLVEDNPFDVEFFTIALDSAELGYDLTVLDDGEEAVALIHREGKYADLRIPDLAVLDLNLPKRDGVEILKELRASALFDDVPVAILTSSSSPRDRARIDEIGVVCFMTKPSALDEIQRVGTTIKDLLMKGEERRKSRVA